MYEAEWVWKVFIPKLVNKDSKLIIDTIEQAILYGKKNKGGHIKPFY